MRRVHVLAMRHADAIEQLLAALKRFSLALSEHMDRRFDDVFKRGHVRPEVEVLEHHRQF